MLTLKPCTCPHSIPALNATRKKAHLTENNIRLKRKDLHLVINNNLLYLRNHLFHDFVTHRRNKNPLNSKIIAHHM